MKQFALLVPILCFYVIVAVSSPITNPSVSLAWDASTSPEVTGYYIHYGVVSGYYTNKLDAGTNLHYTVGNLTQGKLYYFAATAHDDMTTESPYSNEVSYQVPTNSVPSAPTNFRLTP